MRPFPETNNALVLRTDFSDDDAWKSICEAIQKPVGVFQAHVDLLSQPEYDDITPEEILIAAIDTKRTYLFVVDRITLAHPDRPILCIDLFHQPGRTFRLIPSEMWGVENNLSIANMEFFEFASATDQDGIFRGFPGE